MSVRMMAAVWEHSPHRGGTLLVQLAIADHANDAGLAWPSVDGLGRKARMTARNVQLALTRLQDSGSLTIDHRQGAHGCNLYHLSTPERISPPKTFRGEKTDRGGEVSDRGGEKNDTQTVKGVSPEPSLEPSSEPSVEPSGGGRAKARRHTTVDEAYVGHLVAQYAPIFGSETAVRERVGEAMAHTSRHKYSDLRLYVRKWLRKDAEYAAEHAVRTNGRSKTKSNGSADMGLMVAQMNGRHP